MKPHVDFLGILFVVWGLLTVVVGLSTLAVAVGEEQDTIEDVYEPYLLQEGLIKRTPRGRAATVAAFEHLGIELPDPAGQALF